MMHSCRSRLLRLCWLLSILALGLELLRTVRQFNIDHRLVADPAAQWCPMLPSKCIIRSAAFLAPHRPTTRGGSPSPTFPSIPIT